MQQLSEFVAEKTRSSNNRIRSALGGGPKAESPETDYFPDRSYFQNGLSNALAAHEQSIKSRQGERERGVKVAKAIQKNAQRAFGIQVNIKVPDGKAEVDQGEQIDYDTRHLIQHIPECEEAHIVDFHEFDARAFEIFQTESK